MLCGNGIESNKSKSYPALPGEWVLANAGTYAEPLYTYMIIHVFDGAGVWSGVFSSRPQYGILGTRVSRSNHFVRAPSSGGGSNAPRPALFVLHLDVNADRR